ncbi:MAG: hypothetical protein HXS52_05970 [Theionarchaea archaeon]|nr:hypothetical protein [Theionarchaea archaeon]MBU7037457.1 hypothetical protein [Theionarchaea archaeon]
MSHNIRCETAQSQPEECECRCNGEYHGIHRRDLPERAQFVNRKMGGGLGRIIQTLNRRKLVMACGIQIEMVLFIGIEDEEGILDGAGRKWAVYSKCRYLVEGKCRKLGKTPRNTAECKPVIVAPTSSGIAQIDRLSLVEISIICFLSARRVWEFESPVESIVVGTE